MSDQVTKRKRQSRPRFPFITLRKAIARAEQLEKLAGDHPVQVLDAKSAWGYSASSSGGTQTIAALKAYGLLEESSNGNARKLILTDDAIRYFRDEREDVRTSLRKKFAFSPKAMAEMFAEWRSGLPSDIVARSHLKVEKEFTEKAVEEFLVIYKDNLAFSDLQSSDMVSV